MLIYKYPGRLLSWAHWLIVYGKPLKHYIFTILIMSFQNMMYQRYAVPIESIRSEEGCGQVHIHTHYVNGKWSSNGPQMVLILSKALYSVDPFMHTFTH